MIGTWPSNAGCADLVSGQGARIPFASRSKYPKHKEEAIS